MTQDAESPDKPTEPSDDDALTSEQFVERVEELITRARAAGLRPVRTLFRTYIKQGLDLIESTMGALEGDPEELKGKRK